MSQDSLAQLLEAQNPFAEFVVRSQDIWGTGFPDEPSLNAHASDAVFRAIKQLQNGQRKVVGITLRAEMGMGKSHIISRVRNQIQEMGNALFIYMVDYGNLNDIRSEFLKTLAFSLKHTGSKNVTQWQELATDILNDVYQKQFHPNQVIGNLPVKLAKNPDFVENLVDEICLKKPEISDPSLIQAILWTLSPVHAPYAVNWLSGKNLPQSKSDQLGLPNSNKADHSAEAFDITCQILSIISQYKSIVICFDQLDGTEVNDAGFKKAQVIANFGMDLYNNINRGILLTAVYSHIWNHDIRSLSSSEAVIDRIGEQIIDLKALNESGVISLVKKRLATFYAKHNVVPPHALYPFIEEDLRIKAKQRPSARDILQWCCNNWVKPVDNLVETAYLKELNSLDEAEFIDDKSKLARAIGFGFENLIGQTLESVKIDKIDYAVAPKSGNKGYIDFRVIGVEKAKPIKIGVAIIQYPNGIGVQAGLSRLIDYQKFDLTRGCLLRSRDIKPTARRAQQFKDQLIKDLGGEWPSMDSKDLKPLIAIRAVFDAKDDYGFTGEMIRSFISETELASTPSGQIPNHLPDEDTEVLSSMSFPELSTGIESDDLDYGNAA
jgi:hypothetical protein